MLRCLMFVFISISCAVQASELDKVRSAFYKASFEQETCENIYNAIKNNNYEQEPVMMGYQGVYQAIMAQYVWNPITKWWYFKSGVENLELAIQKEQRNIELIFLRFSVQTNCPSFLGYSDNINEDKEFILEKLLDPAVRKRYQPFIGDIVNYMLSSEKLSEAEKSSIYAFRDV